MNFIAYLSLACVMQLPTPVGRCLTRYGLPFPEVLIDESTSAGGVSAIVIKRVYSDHGGEAPPPPKRLY